MLVVAIMHLSFSRAVWVCTRERSLKFVRPLSHCAQGQNIPSLKGQTPHVDNVYYVKVGGSMYGIFIPSLRWEGRLAYFKDRSRVQTHTALEKLRCMIATTNIGEFDDNYYQYWRIL
jgi:hypothetical protein